MLTKQTIISGIIKASSYGFLLIEVYLFCEQIYWSFKKTNQESQEKLLSVEGETGLQTLYDTITEAESSDEDKESIFENTKFQSLANICVNSGPVLITPDLLQRELHDAMWNTALFFPDYLPKADQSTTRKLIWYLSQAKKSIKFCIFSISFPQLEKALQNIKKTGVDIKGVVHVPGSGRRLARQGITTKIWKQSYLNPRDPTRKHYIDLMHHKFLIIDDKYLINGSLNWTREGITGNRENLLITNNERAVKSFLREFEKIWLLSESRIPPGSWRETWTCFLKNNICGSE